MAFSVLLACATAIYMADPAPPVIRDVLDHAWDVAQRLAIEVIEYPPTNVIM
jgi:hypothetical protein